MFGGSHQTLPYLGRELGSHETSSSHTVARELPSKAWVSDASLGRFVPAVWPSLSGSEVVVEASDPLGDKLIDGFPACTFDQYVCEGKRILGRKLGQQPGMIDGNQPQSERLRRAPRINWAPTWGAI